mmetsp:Transcript_3518/g.14064  ORF Transcript_3518/g.14064 Transcript_3518/m.14064 type:complete len:211 (+) Transcript_3518:505-1137(+)
MVVPTQGQWWSNLSMQLSLTLQWCALGGWYRLQVSFHFTVTLLPLGRRSSRYLALARPSGGGRYGSLRTMPGSVVPAATRHPRHHSGHAIATTVNASEYFDATSGTTRALNTTDGKRTSAHVPASEPGDGPVMHLPSQKNRSLPSHVSKIRGSRRSVDGAAGGAIVEKSIRSLPGGPRPSPGATVSGEAAGSRRARGSAAVRASERARRG